MTNAELLAALKTPPEFCFLWIDHWSTCMTKSEWSGWAQAIGAVLAIGVAFGIAVWQEHVRGREAKQVAVIQARNAAGTLAGLVDDIAEKRARTILAIQPWHVAAEQVVLDFRNVRAETLCLEWNVAILCLRNIATHVEVALRAGMVGDGGKSGIWVLVSQERADVMFRTIDDLKNKAAKHMEVLIRDHPGVKMPKSFQQTGTADL